MRSGGQRPPRDHRRPRRQVAGAGDHGSAGHRSAKQGERVARSSSQMVSESGTGARCAEEEARASRWPLPLSVLAARGEKWRSCEGPNPASTAPPGRLDAAKSAVAGHAGRGDQGPAVAEPSADSETSCQKVLTGSSRWPMANRGPTGARSRTPGPTEELARRDRQRLGVRGRSAGARRRRQDDAVRASRTTAPGWLPASPSDPAGTRLSRPRRGPPITRWSMRCT